MLTMCPPLAVTISPLRPMFSTSSSSTMLTDRNRIGTRTATSAPPHRAAAAAPRAALGRPRSIRRRRRGRRRLRTSYHPHRSREARQRSLTVLRRDNLIRLRTGGRWAPDRAATGESLETSLHALHATRRRLHRLPTRVPGGDDEKITTSLKSTESSRGRVQHWCGVCAKPRLSERHGGPGPCGGGRLSTARCRREQRRSRRRTRR